MAAEIKPIRDEAGYNAALAEIERLWGAPSGTAKGDRLEVLITLVDAYEAETFRWTLRTRSLRSSFGWINSG
jgi:HTH-type transcriptional regulator / antitoxin HigA